MLISLVLLFFSFIVDPITYTMELTAGDTIMLEKGKYVGQTAIFLQLSGAVSADVKLIPSNRIVTVRRRSLGRKVLNTKFDPSCRETEELSHSLETCFTTQVTESLLVSVKPFEQVAIELENICLQLTEVQLRLKQIVLSNK